MEVDDQARTGGPVDRANRLEPATQPPGLDDHLVPA